MIEVEQVGRWWEAGSREIRKAVHYGRNSGNCRLTLTCVGDWWAYGRQLSYFSLILTAARQDVSHFSSGRERNAPQIWAPPSPKTARIMETERILPQPRLFQDLSLSAVGVGSEVGSRNLHFFWTYRVRESGQWLNTKRHTSTKRFISKYLALLKLHFNNCLWKTDRTGGSGHTGLPAHNITNTPLARNGSHTQLLWSSSCPLLLRQAINYP